MEKIEKYNHYSDDIKNGDIVVFKDNSRKAIRKIEDGHKVTFEDGSKRDLWIVEDQVEGIIHMHVKRTLPISATIISGDCERIDVFNDKKESFGSLATSFKELNKKLYHGGDGVEFYHLTAIQNALAIFQGDYFYSRESASGIIKYDNVKLNEITDSVMSSNRSVRLEKYARFYLNIKNKATYAMHKNFDNNHSFGVIIALGFSSIWKSKTNVILSPINAHDLIDSDFDWSKYNIGFEKNIKNLDASRFNLEKTFEDCDFISDNPFLLAEILFFDKIGLENVSNIYFKSSREMNYFLDNLPYNKRALLQVKCSVKEELFW